MGKSKKISTDKLIQIIEKYIAATPYVGKLKYSDLVTFSKEIGYCNLIYQDFSRNPEIKQIVNEFNEKNTLLNINKFNSTEGLKKITLNVDTIVETYANDKKTQKALLNIFKDSYSKAFERIQLLEENNNKLLDELSTLNDTLNKIVIQNKSLKAEIKKSKEDAKEKRKINQEIRIMNLVEYLIKKDCVQKLTKDEIVEVMKNIYYPTTSTSDLLESSDFTDNIKFMNSDLTENNSDREVNNIVPLNANFFD